MRFIIMHRTNPHWEAGAVPSPDLIARVGGMLGALSKAGALESGEGLRPSSEGVRIRFSAGVRTVIPGPFDVGADPPAGFTILRAQSLDEAIEWASREAEVLGGGEIDIRPVTEPWDIGVGARPANVSTRRYMILRKATAASEAGAAPSPEQRAKLSQLVDETAPAGAHLVTETMRPSGRGRRYKNSREGVRVLDGPFTEAKEMIGGYVIVSADSIEQADRYARQYLDIVDADEVDLRELEQRD